MISYICMSTAQIVGFLILVVIACGIIFLCGVLKKKIDQKNIMQTVKVSSVNLDAEEDSAKVEGVSLLAKRKYIVSEQNKIKPMMYTLVDADNTIIVINNIETVYNAGDCIEFKDGDTVSAKDETVMLSHE